MYSLPNTAIQQIFQQYTCPVCLSQFDNTSHYPMLVCPSLHIACKKCAQMVLFGQSVSESYCPQCHALIDRDNVSKFRYTVILDKMKGIVEVECQRSKWQVLEIYIDEQDEKIRNLTTSDQTKTKQIEALKLQISQLQQQILTYKSEIQTLKQSNTLTKKHNPQQHPIKSYISQQQQQQIPENIEQQLTKTNILSITNLQKWQQVQQQQAINLQNNNFVIRGLECLGSLSKLKALSLRDCNLEGLPENIGDIVSLVYLQVDTNRIRELPESMCQLCQLTFLHVYHNQLTVLPENFGKLENLSQLFASQNKLSCLPSSFAKLKYLTVLSLQSNPLTQFPTNFTSLTHLEYLQFTIPPKSQILHSLKIPKMKQLKKLIIWYSQHIEQEENQKLLQDCLSRQIILEFQEEIQRVR